MAEFHKVSSLALTVSQPEQYQDPGNEARKRSIAMSNQTIMYDLMLLGLLEVRPRDLNTHNHLSVVKEEPLSNL